MISKPEKIGPGYWVQMHLMAIYCQNDVDKFLDYMNFLITTFPCATCRYHINKYVMANPIQRYISSTDKKYRLFRWTWMFHNDTNLRLGKSYLPWNEACSLYNIV